MLIPNKTAGINMQETSAPALEKPGATRRPFIARRNPSMSSMQSMSSIKQTNYQSTPEQNITRKSAPGEQQSQNEYWAPSNSFSSNPSTIDYELYTINYRLCTIN
jgi:hypothetical protein